MKILMFGWEFPPHISGGLGTACFGITKSLTSLGTEVVFVVPKSNFDYTNAPIKIIKPDDIIESDEKKSENEFDNSANREELFTQSLLKEYKIDAMLHPYMTEESYLDHIKNQNQQQFVAYKSGKNLSVTKMNNDIYGPSLMMEVERYALIGKYISNKESFDLIHAHDWMTFKAAVEAKNISGKPLVIHIHATEFDRTANHINSEIYCIEKYGMDMADKIITVSNRTKETIVNKYNIDPSKVEVVYNAVEKEAGLQINTVIEKSALSNDKIVLFLGRITAQKCPEFFIVAAYKVIKTYKNVRFVMAGAGDLSKKMIEKMAELKIVDRFLFTGFLNQVEREKLFAMSDLYVMPSVSEPFGITPLEAMKHGIPTIVSKQSGVSEILGDNAIQIDFWDVDKLSTAIIKVLSDKKLSKKMSKKGMKTVEKIDWNNTADDLLSIYKKLL